MYEPIWAEMHPEADLSGYLDAVRGQGWVALTAGTVILIAPIAVNIMIALTILAFGLLHMFLVARATGSPYRGVSPYVLIALGVTLLFMPELLNILTVLFLAGLIFITAVSALHFNARGISTFLLGLGIFSASLMIAYPSSIQLIMAASMIIFGAERLLFTRKNKTGSFSNS